MRMDRETGKSIQGAKIKVYQGTSVSSTRLRQKNKDGSRCIRLRNRRGFIYGM